MMREILWVEHNPDGTGKMEIVAYAEGIQFEITSYLVTLAYGMTFDMVPQIVEALTSYKPVIEGETESE